MGSTSQVGLFGAWIQIGYIDFNGKGPAYISMTFSDGLLGGLHHDHISYHCASSPQAQNHPQLIHPPVELGFNTWIKTRSFIFTDRVSLCCQAKSTSGLIWMLNSILYDWVIMFILNFKFIYSWRCLQYWMECSTEIDIHNSGRSSPQNP